MTAPNCENCHFSEKQQRTDARGQPEVGIYFYQCRRFPPSVVVLPNAQGALMASQFPPVDKTMCCYEHRPSARAANDANGDGNAQP